MSTAALRLAGVSVGYSGTPVVTGVDLELGPGQRLALVGPNGAGKSTLIKSFLGLADVLDGDATVLGRTPARARAHTGYVPQTGNLDPDFPVSVRQVVMMGRYRQLGWWRPARSADRRAVADALDRVGFADRTRRPRPVCWCPADSPSAPRSWPPRAGSVGTCRRSWSARS